MKLLIVGEISISPRIAYTIIENLIKLKYGPSRVTQIICEASNSGGVALAASQVAEDMRIPTQVVSRGILTTQGTHYRKLLREADSVLLIGDKSNSKLKQAIVKSGKSLVEVNGK